MNKGKKRYVPEEIVEKKVLSSKIQKIANPGATVAKNKVETKTKKKKNECVKKRENGSDEVEEKKVVVPPENKDKKTVKGSSSDESSDSSSDCNEPKPSSKTQRAKKDESESSDDNDSSSNDKPQTPATPGSNYVYMGNLSRCMKEEEVHSFFKDTGKVVSVRLHKSDRRLFCFAHVRFETSETAQKALKRNGELLYDYPVELFLVHDEISNLDLDPRSKFYNYEYLFMENLSPSTRINDVLDFFKGTGKIVLIRFDKSWGRFSGCGHVQFSTPEEARKGLKRNKEKLLGHAVELVLTTDAITSVGFTPYWRKVGPIGYGPTVRGYRPTVLEER